MNKIKHIIYGERSFQVISTLLFALFSLVLLERYGYVWKWVESLSLFVPDPLLFRAYLNNPGGLLAYAGSFLTQFLYYPLLGSLLLTLLLLLVQRLTWRLSNWGNLWFPASFIPSFLLLSTVLDLGYTWATLKAPGHFFAPTLGVIFALACLLLFRKIPSSYGRLAATLLITACYPFCGFYALLASGLCLTDEALNRPGKSLWATLIAGIAAIYLFPRLYYLGIDSTEQELSRLYVAGLPPFYIRKAELMIWLPFLLLPTFYLLSLLLPALLGDRGLFKPARRSAACSWGLFLLGLLFTLWQTYDDPNFEAAVRSSLAIEAGDWEEAAKATSQVKSGATRDVVINNQLASSRLGRPVNWSTPLPMIPETYKDSRPGLLTFMQLSGLTMNYYSGQTNLCYRWAMEMSVEFGFRVTYLKTLVKCALLNGELALAQKYNDQLKRTLFHKDWADRYQRYIDQPELIGQDPEFSRIPKDPLPNRFIE